MRKGGKKEANRIRAFAALVVFVFFLFLFLIFLKMCVFAISRQISFCLMSPLKNVDFHSKFFRFARALFRWSAATAYDSFGDIALVSSLRFLHTRCRTKSSLHNKRLCAVASAREPIHDVQPHICFHGHGIVQRMLSVGKMEQTNDAPASFE